MKAKFFTRILAIGALMAALWTIPSEANAQASCPYTLNNNTSCMLEITYTIWCANGWYSNTVNIAPNTSYIIQCWEFPNPDQCDTWDIELNLVRVDGQDFVCVVGSSNTVASSVPNANTQGMFAGTNCDPINIVWGTTQCDYNP